MRKAVACGIVLFASLLVGTARGQSLNDQLITAVFNGDRAKAETLITSGADVNYKTEDGETPLYIAASYDKSYIAASSYDKSVAVAELLVAKGADVNAETKYGRSVLMEASANGNKDLASLLLDKGADVNAQDKDGRTPLYYAASNFGGYAASHYGKTDKSVESGQASVAERLIANGADVNAKGNQGFTPLHEAASNGMAIVAELLIAKGADINAKDKGFGNTPLHSASERGDVTTAELLIAKGAGVNTKNDFGETPLHVAACTGGKDMAVLLIAKGADVNVKGGLRDTALEEAIHCGAKDVVELLIANHANVNDEVLQKAKYGNGNEQIKREIGVILQSAMEKQSGNDIQTLLAEFKGHSENQALLATIVDLALKQHSTIPPEAEAAAGRGAYIFKNATSMDDKLSAAKEYLTAIELAPWVANYYFNLCTVLEKTPYTQQALHACKLYLLAAPSAADAAEMNQRIAGLQYASDRDKAQMKQRTLYIKKLEQHDLYSLGGVSGTVSGHEIAMKLFVDWTAAPPKYQVAVGCLQGNDVYGTPHDLVSTDNWIQLCSPAVNMHLVISPEGEGFVAVSDSSGGSLRATLDDLFKAKQQTMAQAIMFQTGFGQETRFFVTYGQGGLDEKRAGYAFYESDCNGNMLKKDPRALPDDFVSMATVRATQHYGNFYPEVVMGFNVPVPGLCTTQFANKTGYHFGEQE